MDTLIKLIRKGGLKAIMEKDMVNHPPHYTSKAVCDKCNCPIECIDITRHMSFNLGNAVKYLWRWQSKGGLEDLRKARWYLEDAINDLERKREQNATTGIINDQQTYD
jgi:hypothetical protein